jgi:hypothetical protein
MNLGTEYHSLIILDMMIIYVYTSGNTNSGARSSPDDPATIFHKASKDASS